MAITSLRACATRAAASFPSSSSRSLMSPTYGSPTRTDRAERPYLPGCGIVGGGNFTQSNDREHQLDRDQLNELLYQAYGPNWAESRSTARRSIAPSTTTSARSG